MKKTTFAIVGLWTITAFSFISVSANYSQEFQDAYKRAYSKSITTMPTIEKANMQWKIKREEMAKMISNYAKKVLWMKPDTSKSCNFSDIDLALGLKDSVIESCKLWLMGQWITKFRPNDTVSRAEFWTVLSRLLYWNQYEWWSPYYQNHLNALNKNWIIKNISNPSMEEVRWYVMIMLMRTDNSDTNTNSSNTTDKTQKQEESTTTDDSSLMYKNSDFIEKEQPTLTDETKQLIATYQRNRTEENYLKLREEVIKNYNAVLVKKEAKLDELKEETAWKTNWDALVKEMEEIVQDMYITYWNSINSVLLRFTDSRLLSWRINEASKYEYIPVMWAWNSIYIKRTPVTNKEYKAFIDATNYKAPSNWTNWNYPKWEDDYPVNYVSYNDAVAYTNWLTKTDWKNTYRLPTESEWELAAWHMPKDADFNNWTNWRVSVDKYTWITRWAQWAVDFWWNVWEWTSTERSTNTNAVKWGSYKSARTDCRTEHRKEWRNVTQSYDDVGFRVIQVLNWKEPEQSVDLYTLEAPKLTAKKSNSNVILSWNKVEWAYEYQIYEYNESTKLFTMLWRTKELTATVKSNWNNMKYIVQALWYTWISANVSEEYWVKAN